MPGDTDQISKHGCCDLHRGIPCGHIPHIAVLKRLHHMREYHKLRYACVRSYIAQRQAAGQLNDNREMRSAQDAHLNISSGHNNTEIKAKRSPCEQ